METKQFHIFVFWRILQQNTKIWNFDISISIGKDSRGKCISVSVWSILVLVSVKIADIYFKYVKHWYRVILCRVMINFYLVGTHRNFVDILLKIVVYPRSNVAKKSVPEQSSRISFESRDFVGTWFPCILYTFVHPYYWYFGLQAKPGTNPDIEKSCQIKLDSLKVWPRHCNDLSWVC